MDADRKQKKVVLISNTVMHYRVSVYNYFWKRFQEEGWEFEVLTNCMQGQNATPLRFLFAEIPLQFRRYRQAILKRKPDAIIQFLHLKDPVIWTLTHWLKWKRIPVAFWTKTRNLDAPHNYVSNRLFDYMMWLHDGLILYSKELMTNVAAGQRHKAFVANNTINFDDFPKIDETKDEIKRQLGIPFSKVVLFAGRMDVEGGRKRVDHLIEIFRAFDDSEVGLVIVGSGMKQEWKARINPRTTLYLGEVHDPSNLQISRIFSMADVFAMPGHVGLGVNQAFYFGLPVVTEGGLHPPEIGYLKPGRNGFIVPENDLAALRAKICELLENDSLRKQLSSNAREDILREASIEGMFQAFHKCVERISKARVADY